MELSQPAIPEARTLDPGQLAATKVVAILRARDTSRVAGVVDALVSAGVTCLELTLTTRGALDSLSALTREYASVAAIGAGTVRTPEDATRAVAAGATFLVSPTLSPAVADFAVRTRIPFYPGALSPTEIVSAWDNGASCVKVFPASLGGLSYIRQLRGPLPDIALMPTGGVTIAEAPHYLRAGAAYVAMGSPLIQDALEGGVLSALSSRAKLLLTEIRDVCGQ
jgi:2-dehydro-3-deoxyphosphogluconate aldolase / (4S)-4-hydroxy-2-oxoglutarate aldolase